MSGRVVPVPLVVVAASARALAECLRRARLPARGAPLLAVDAFGDDDLIAGVDGWQRLALADLRDPQRVCAAVDAVLGASMGANGAQPQRADVLLGGGFDGAPAVLDALSQRYRLLNASPTSWRAARDPLVFVRLGIAAPETRLAPPVDPRGWLRKTVGGSAGLGVEIAAANGRVGSAPVGQPGPGRPGIDGDADERSERHPADGSSAPRGEAEQVYWQRRVYGTPVSILFCAHSAGVLVVGVNRQWCSPTPELPFRFGGVASGFEPGPEVRAMLLDAAAHITVETGLRGLCSLDAIIDRHGRAHALELNPRPGASVELYDRAAPGLVRLHLAAVLGEPLPEWHPPTGAHALALVHAPLALRVGEQPAAASDWRRGAEVDAGEPLCTVHASGPDVAVAMRRARAAAARLVRRSRSGANPFRLRP